MRHVVLEVFENAMATHNAEAMIVSASLAALENEKQAEYQRGFEEGLAEAMRQQQRSLEEGRALLLAWQKSEISHLSEIRRDLLEDMRPLFEAVIANVLPTAAKLSLLPLAVEHLLTQVRTDLPDQLSLSVHPDDYDDIAPFITDPLIEIRKDDSLLQGRYGLQFEQIEATFDIGRLCTETTELIRAFFAIEPERGSDD